jgi:hypothetical protein
VKRTWTNLCVDFPSQLEALHCCAKPVQQVAMLSLSWNGERDGCEEVVISSSGRLSHNSEERSRRKSSRLLSSFLKTVQKELCLFFKSWLKLASKIITARTFMGLYVCVWNYIFPFCRWVDKEGKQITHGHRLAVWSWDLWHLWSILFSAPAKLLVLLEKLSHNCHSETTKHRAVAAG